MPERCKHYEESSGAAAAAEWEEAAEREAGMSK